MALVDNAWYVNYGDGSTTGYYALTKWATGTVTAAGTIVRQNAAPAVGSERVFVCVVAGTTHATTEPTWTLTRGAKTTDNTVTWQECTGIAALNGDATNTPTWTITATPPGGVKNTSVTLGQVIKRDSAASYQICTTAGTAGNGSEPAFSNTAGTTTADNTVTWTSLGVVGNFTGWQAPHARLSNALASTWCQVSNTLYVRSNNVETRAAAITHTFPGTPASPNFIYSVDVADTALPPTTLLAGASIQATSQSFTNNGSAYVYGVQFEGSFAGTAQSQLAMANASQRQVYDTCVMKFAHTNNYGLTMGGGNQSVDVSVKWVNTTLNTASTGFGMCLQGTRFIWENTASALVGAAVPTSIFGNSFTIGHNVFVSGVDLSAAGAGKTLVSAQAATSRYLFQHCKLGASVTVAATPTGGPGCVVDAIDCDSSGTNYRTERYNYLGTQTSETTIVRTGGATDGTTLMAWKIVTSANSKWVLPFESLPITIWGDTTASTTVTVYGIWGGGAVPNNDEIWMEIEYLGSSGSPQGSFATTTKASNLAAGSATTTDSSTWGGSTTAFKMAATFTPGQKGPINIVIKAAKVSSTFYIDPRPEISGVTVSKSLILSPGVYANEVGSVAGTSGISRARAAAGFH